MRISIVKYSSTFRFLTIVCYETSYFNEEKEEKVRGKKCYLVLLFVYDINNPFMVIKYYK